MSDLLRLRELAALLQSKPQPEPVVTEARSLTADFNGVKGVVDDALADLHDKLAEGGQLETLLDQHGLSSLADKALEQLSDTVAKLKKDVEGLLLEIELVVASTTNEGMAHGTRAFDPDWSAKPEDLFKGTADHIVDALKKSAKTTVKALAALDTYLRGAGRNAKNKAELMAARAQLAEALRDERTTLSEGRLTRASAIDKAEAFVDAMFDVKGVQAHDYERIGPSGAVKTADGFIFAVNTTKDSWNTTRQVYVKVNDQGAKRATAAEFKAAKTAR